MRVRGGLVGVAAVCAALAFASPAQADQYEFVSYLDDNGVYYASITDMIDIGKALCHDLRSGDTPPIVMARLGNTGFASAESALILVSAINYMCVDAKPAVAEWARASGYSGPV